MKKIEDDFKASGGKFEEYRIGELFEKCETKSLKIKVSEAKTTLDEIFNLPALTAGIENQGLSCFVPREKATILQNVISVSANGANTGAMFYQPNEFTILQDSYAIKYKTNILTKNEYLYMVAALQKTIRGNFDWSNKAGWNRIKSEKTLLPTKNGDIDFSYMESVICELEEERIRELSAYLKESGLENTELSQQEKDAVLKLRNGEVEWKEFKVGELFEPLKVGFIGKGEKIGSALKYKTKEYSIPLTCAKIGDNGIMYWAKEGDFITYENTLSVIADGAVSAGLVYAQPERAGAYSHSYFIKVKDIEVAFEANIFLSAILTKVIYPQYSRDRSPRWKRIMKEKIHLPLTPTGTIDWQFMEMLITAESRLAIRGVVEWRDKVIAKTREVAVKEK